MIPRNEILHCEKWWELAEYNYEGQNDLPSGIVAVDPQNIAEFFGKIHGNRRKYVVITSRSDYGICYQAENPPAKDLIKWIEFQINPVAHGYNDIMCRARLNKERCDINHKYSVKCWSFTDSTFDTIPDEVTHWFIANCDIDEPRVYPIPFGIHNTEECLDALSTYNVDESIRKDEFYCNWQFYTLKRYKLYQQLVNNTSLKYHFTWERDVPYRDYLKRLNEHKFVLCPRGNGIDCFRTIEAIYMGCIPIFEWRWTPRYLYADLCDYLPYKTFDVVLHGHHNIVKNISKPARKLQKNFYWSYWKNYFEETIKNV